jgi:hypothetical protein
MSGIQFNIDVTNWPLPLRTELLEIIDQFDMRADARSTGYQEEVPDDDPEASGWNQEAYLDVIVKLLDHHNVQVAVIFEAIKNGTGYVTRERVYELGNYKADRSLKGFTRPVNRFTADAVEAGLLPEDADDLLAPDYDPNIKGFHRARGFRVPLHVVRMAEAWRSQQEADKA